MSTGVDISSFQGGISGANIRRGGHEFAIIKATQGQEYVNPYLDAQINTCRQANLPIGLFHFLDASDPDGQARNFTRVAVSRLRPGDLPATLDFESNDVPGQGGTASHSQLDAVRVAVQRAGLRTMTYTGSYFWAMHGSGRCGQCAADPLWLAQYGASPTAPAPWSRWTLWQFTSTSTSVAGIAAIDVSTTDHFVSLINTGGNTMTPDEARELSELHDGTLTPLPAAFITDPAGHPLAPAQLAAWAGRWALINEGGLAKVSVQLDRLKEQVAALQVASPAVPSGGTSVDLAAVTAAADAGAAAAIERLLAHVVLTMNALPSVPPAVK